MNDIDPRWPRLLAAARAWQATVIPATSTGLAAQTRLLHEAIAAFDNCDHQRVTHIFFPDGHVECSCGAVVKPPDPATVPADHDTGP